MARAAAKNGPGVWPGCSSTRTVSPFAVGIGQDSRGGFGLSACPCTTRSRPITRRSDPKLTARPLRCASRRQVETIRSAVAG